ncbi:MAG: hypothetical protein JWO47_243 [Candidatus Saccharibacteria bacterium]|nr:hypothetical protein [Candidatus Saccharibacteria bacterium]
MEPEVNKPEETKAPDELAPVTSAETPVAATVGIMDDKKPSKKKMLIILAVILVIAAVIIPYLVFSKDKPASSSTAPAQKVAATKTAAPVPTEAEKQLARLTTPTTGETWNTEPKTLPLQGFLNKSDYTESSDEVSYYEVGKHGANTIIMGIYYGGGEIVELYEKAPDGKVTVITHPDGNATYSAQDDSYTKDRYRTDVIVDTIQHYDSLSIPSQFSLGNNEVATKFQYPSLGEYFPDQKADASVKETAIKTYGATTLLKIERKYADTGLTAISYKLKLAIGTDYSLTYTPIKQDFSSITWDDSSILTGKFGGIVRGCGAGISVSRGDNVTDADFVKSGIASNGNVYNFKDTSNVTVQKAWQETKDFYAGNDDPANKAKATITLDAFLAKHGIFAYKDKNNGWLIYTNDDYAPIGGCAKPVVYLYPIVAENVSVKVGADVKISDPLYNPSIGWQAFAQPNGQLTVGGKTYGSLFWEGPGHGDYPGITAGTVVKHADVVSTMRTQLAQQGLNQNEINDFVDYWQTRIPNKPYVRLAWFNTDQMNKLAPLTISPKPTTTIRVFLDMAGSDSNFSMVKPQFSAPARNGFTAVEWGGLSLSKLY